MTLSLIQFWNELSPIAWFGLKLAQVWVCDCLGSYGGGTCSR